MTRTLVVVVSLLIGMEASSSPAQAQSPPGPQAIHYVYVCAESEDEVAIVRFGPDGLELVKTIPVGSFPAETEGPHGITVDPDGRHWYVSIAHGLPFGSVHKYETETDRWVGDVTLGMFPATLDVSAATGLLYAVNFDLHGPMEPSTVSVVETDTMTEVERVWTGIMPHGSRFGRDGLTHYSVAMMGDQVVEIDGLSFEVGRTLSLSGPTGSDAGSDHHAGLEDPAQGLVQPTWVTPIDDKLYVTGNAVDEIYEIDIEQWRVTRTFETGPGPYNLDVTRDGSTLIATYKKGAAVGFWDLDMGTERARVTTSRAIPHGVVVTPDGEYAFVTLEGIGGEPGTVEVYRIATGERLGAVDIGKQAGGIAYWKTVRP